jgi:threonine synthase
MDIMVSSNFERMLFDLYDRDGDQIRRLMDEFKESGRLTLAPDALSKAQSLFSSYRLSDEETIAVIREVFESTEYLLDPHTAIGVQAGRKTRVDLSTPMVCLATAHPAKFPEAVRQAGQSQDPALPHHMQDLFAREERYQVLSDDLTQLKTYISGNIRA